MIPRVVAVEHLGGHRLRLVFDDGVEGEVDLACHLEWSAIFEPLRDPDYVAQVRLPADGGTVEWPNGAEIDPVVLRSWATGEPLPDWALPLEEGGG